MPPNMSSPLATQQLVLRGGFSLQLSTFATARAPIVSTASRWRMSTDRPTVRHSISYHKQDISVSQLQSSSKATESLSKEEEYEEDAYFYEDYNRKTQLLAVFLGLGLALGSAEAAMALGPEGPLVEEFWDNMRRYGLYFITVATGGIYSILQPIFALLKNPITAVLTFVAISGSFYLMYLILNTMLGITVFDYQYAQ